MMFLRAFLVAFFLTPLAATQALYDPKPLADIVLMQGEWKGALTYNDYSAPGKLVTLPTRWLRQSKCRFISQLTTAS